VSDELMRQVRGDMRVRRGDQAAVSRGREVYDEVRLAGLKVDGIMALSAHAMEATAGLDAHRKLVAGDDQVLNAVCADYEATAITDVKKIQRNLFNAWES
jgi:hypothetical protein